LSLLFRRFYRSFKILLLTASLSNLVSGHIKSIKQLAITDYLVYSAQTMGTKVTRLDVANINSAEISVAACLIDAGGLVAFPTETVYGIAAKVERTTLTKLNKLKGRPPEKNYTLHIAQKSDLQKYVPSVSLRARKLINATWPGPLTLVFELTEDDLDKQRTRLKVDVFENLYRNNSIGIRCPDHPVAESLLKACKNPVVAPSANKTDAEPAVDAEAVLAQFSGQIDLVLDAGPSKYKKSSTVVKIGKLGLQILRHGAFPEEQLEKISQVKFLFVCTGNTCRSPMATGIFRKYLAEKLNCTIDHLPEIGYKVFSAGTLGLTGAPASAEAVAVCAAKGIDITAHRSVALTRLLVSDCDFIFVMEQMHRNQVIALDRQCAGKCLLLAESDIADPIGRSQQVYNDCADRIEKAVKKRIDEFVI
jgi:tRNA threonylcarbamoyl adenosine modification protein (Sua5/YciO/YrdC/YwlC family)